MTSHQYTTRGVCSRRIELELDEEGCVHNVSFIGGCNGNLKGIGKLVEGQSAEDVADRLEGVTCGPRPTSCPDQLSRALREALAQKALAE